MPPQSENHPLEINRDKPAERPFIIGIGASAGGLEALSQLLPNLPKDLGLSYVVVQHLSPTYRSMLTQLLGRETTMPVRDIEDGAIPEPNVVYITPPNRNVTLNAGCFRLVVPAKESLPKPSANLFFASLAEEAAELCIGIILSGTGSDGAHGIHAIKAAGGFTFAQDPSTAKYNGMPQSAIDTGSVDWILPPENMGAEIALIVQNHGRIPMATQAEDAPATLKTLLAKVRMRTKVDFSQYKEPTLWRRIERRMAANHVGSLPDYLALVDEKPVELEKLCKDILISVTSFFRDTEAFTGLEKVVKRILVDKQPGDDIRIWVAGCATGEEAYSLAILFAEHLGSAFDQYRIQIFATDIDLEAMGRARRGIFAATSLAQMDRSRLKAHFTGHGDRYEINKNLRDVVIFARQDLVQDPPFLRLDLVTCRNVLIYFQSELQARLFSVFHYALNPGGYMFLGKSESIFQQEGLFEVVDKEARLFSRSGAPARMPPPRSDTSLPAAGLNQYQNLPVRMSGSGFEQLLLEAAGKHFIPLTILVNGKFEIRHIHGDASRFLNISAGKPAFDLISLIRRELRTEIQVLLRQAQVKHIAAQGRPRHIKAIDPQRGVRISVHPLPDPGQDELFMVCIEWIAPGSTKSSTDEGSANVTDRELEDELAATREHLQTLVEELETSNEEMQALNEEIQASNEEMQASNEELEAANEELQSTNEELATVNEELQIKTTETQELNIDLESIQNSGDYPLLVLDENQKLLRFNRAALQLFKLGLPQIGQLLHKLPLPKDMPDLGAAVQKVIETHLTYDRQIVNANKRHYALHITPLLRDKNRVAGAILLFVDNTVLYESEKGARENQERLLAVMSNSVSLMAVKDASGRYQFANPKFERSFGFATGQVIGKTDFQIFPHTVSDPFRESELEVMRQRKDIQREEVLHLNGEDRTCLVVRFPLFDDDGAIKGICFQATDITERKKIEQEREQQKDRLEELVAQRTIELSQALETAKLADRTKDAFLANMSHELRTPLNAVIGMAGLARNICNDPRQAEFLDKISVSGKHLSHIINDLLDLSKISAGHMEMEFASFSLRGLIRRATSLLAHGAAEKQLQLLESVDAAVPDVLLGDASRIEQILLNLLNNAIKFTEAGQVELRVEVHAMEAHRVCLEIEVEDSGRGILPEEIDRLFKPFSQADSTISRKFGGTGLGLAISKRLAEMMGGDISVSSQAGVGAKFQVRLWLGLGNPADLPDNKVAVDDALPVSYRDTRILVVEDQPLNREIVEALLDAVKIAPQMAEDGQQALDILEKSGAGAFDLVLMDIQMPVMDGLSATRALRSRDGFAALPVIAMTASTMKHERENSVAAGMNDHIGKPFDNVSFYRTLARWIPESKQNLPSRPLKSGKNPAKAKPAAVVDAPVQADPASTAGSASSVAGASARAGLETLRGIDVANGIARFNGKEERYRHWLADFLLNAGSLPETICTDIAAGHRSEAAKKIHAFKGRVGMLGMSDLHGKILALELALHNSAPLGGFLSAVSQSIGELCSEIARVLDNGAANLKKPPPRPEVFEKMVWSETFSVGVDELDEQHMKLFLMINQLADCRADGDGRSAERFREILSRMFDYTQFHFKTEEAYLESIAYPERGSHPGGHIAFVEKMTAFNMAASDGVLDIEGVYRYLREWLKSHILQSDMAYRRFLENKKLPKKT